MRIGELSRRTGCKVETIRYYERIGLMPEPPRLGQYRSYGAADIERLRFIRSARQLDFSLEEARLLIKLAATEGESCADVRQLALKHVAELRSRIADLQSIERSLARAADTCEAVEDRCPVIAQVNAGKSVSADDIRVW